MKKLLIPLFLLLIITGCGNENKKEINNILDTRQKAFNTKDADLYKSLISDNYSDTEDGKTINKEDIIKKFKMNTSPFDSIDMQHSERVVEIKGKSATAVQKTTAKLRINDETANYELREIIGFTHEKNAWRISKESKFDLFRGFVFGNRD